MRIAILVHGFPKLSETFIVNQVTALLDRGHDVRIHALVRGDTARPHRAIDTYNLLARSTFFAMPESAGARGRAAVGRLARRSTAGRIARHPRLLRDFGAEWRTLKLPFALAGLPRPQRYDVLHAHFGDNGNVAAALRDARVLEGPLVTSFHGVDATAYPRRWGPGVYRRLFAAGDAFTANSRFLADKALALGCPPDRLHLVPAALYVERFGFAPRVRPADDAFAFLTVARLVEKKGLALSLAAFARVHARFPRARYAIVGDGPLRAPLERQIADLGLRAAVRLLGPRTQEEIVDLAGDHHVFVLASVTGADGDHEGQGLVLQEAQALGMPVVASDHNGFPDSLLDGVSGTLVPEGDVDALAAAMIALCERADAWPAMGRAGRAFVAERFDQPAVADRLLDVYERARARRAL